MWSQLSEWERHCPKNPMNNYLITTWMYDSRETQSWGIAGKGPFMELDRIESTWEEMTFRKSEGTIQVLSAHNMTALSSH